MLSSRLDARQGDEFKLNVIDKLEEQSLDLGTSIVRFLLSEISLGIRTHSLYSIGTAYSKVTPTMTMVLPLSPSVPLYPKKASYTTLRFRAKRYCSLLTSQDHNQLTLSLFQGTFWYHSHFRNQYCDGLRGALIIDDPNDPHQHLYDIDNGRISFRRECSFG